MSINVDVQYAYHDNKLPGNKQIDAWVRATLNSHKNKAELTIRIVDEKEGKELNEQWRNSQGATNVLSFPAKGVEAVEPDLLGDIIICAPVVQKEARQQSKSDEAHWAHMVIHGTLHLLGYDHINEQEAEEMESIEIRILEQLGYSNPYISDSL